DKIAKAEAKIIIHPYDVESWNVLIRDAQTKKIDDVRPFYEKLIEQFPNSGKYWKIYIEHEVKSKNYEKVEKLFQRCLMKVYHIDLWKQYLSYIKETKVTLPSYRQIIIYLMAQAYDFALDKIGMDVNAYPIWLEYINFLKSVEATGSYAENQRITAVRKVYHKAIMNPMLNIELLWKDYCAFENGINPLIAKKMQDDRFKDYTNTRRVAKEYEVNTKGINKNVASIPPKNTVEEIKQVELWKKYIQWEKSNPSRIEDQTTITKRVMFAYEQCLLCLGLHPDVWIEAANYLEQSSKLLAEKGSDTMSKVFADEAANMYERAISMGLKNCLLIYFSYADFEESRMKHEKVHSIYKRALELQDVETTLIYIQYMRFARRAEGIKSARYVFKMAREDQRTKFHVYVTAALMEHYCSKDGSIALKIFELAFKKFGHQYEFVNEFINYTSHLNEDNNTRVLFERILTANQIPHEKTLDIWNKFVEFEANVGDLACILKLEKRRLQAFGSEYEGKETSLLIDRYKFLDLYPCLSHELRSMGFKHDNINNSTNSISNNIDSSDLDLNVKRSRFSRGRLAFPNVNQMLPFKPKIGPSDSSHPVPGGVFPPPPAVTDLLLKLPPPSSFTGPFVIVDQLMRHFSSLNIPDEYIPGETCVDYPKIDLGTQYSIEASLIRKRKHFETNDDGSDDEMTSSTTNPPPAHDVFRLRQQKRAK
ncbi:hypothetical protein HELRODRAFT_64205, partial [Helobdella robusta]|uniref:Suppressor of forked domain-containing protein n=1 Tax=Helobdella robusta TaxID=6412 RepID=T1FXR4_HELRO